MLSNMRRHLSKPTGALLTKTCVFNSVSDGALRTQMSFEPDMRQHAYPCPSKQISAHAIGFSLIMSLDGSASKAAPAQKRHVAWQPMIERYSVSMAGRSAPLHDPPGRSVITQMNERTDRHAIRRHDRASSRATTAPDNRTDRDACPRGLPLSRDRAQHALCAYRQRRDRGHQNGKRYSRHHSQPSIAGGTAAKSERTAGK